jgi:hypothetical protein
MRRPRFKTPGAWLALGLFVLASLLYLWGSRPGGPASALVPSPRSPEASPPPAAPAPGPDPVPSGPQADGCPQGCLKPPPGCDVKGNTSYRTGELIYHLPGQQFYDRTVIDPGQGERWFCTEEEAITNGWRKSKR